MPTYEYRDGEMVEVPDLVVSESGDLYEDVNTTLVIRSGVSLTLYGRVSGTVHVEQAATVEARGDVSGTVHIESTAEATFHQAMAGTLHVEPGGMATLARSAVALGTLHVDGTLVNYGTRGTQILGSGTVDDRENSTVREPDETWEDGTVVYRD